MVDADTIAVIADVKTDGRGVAEVGLCDVKWTEDTGRASTGRIDCVAKTGGGGTAAHRAGVVDVGLEARTGGWEGGDALVEHAHATTTCIAVALDSVLNVLGDKVDGAGNAT